MNRQSKYSRGGGYNRLAPLHDSLYAWRLLPIIALATLIVALSPNLTNATDDNSSVDVSVDMPTVLSLSVTSEGEACTASGTDSCLTLKWADDQKSASGTQDVTVKTNDSYGYTLSVAPATTDQEYNLQEYNLTNTTDSSQKIPFTCKLGDNKNKICTVNRSNSNNDVFNDTHKFSYIVNDKASYQYQAGTYKSTVRYTLTANDATVGTTEQSETELSTCRNGDSNSECQVDLDANMIPVKYTGSTAKAEWTIADDSVTGDWYDYSPEKKRWANAVTVKDPAVFKNADGSYKVGTKVSNDDVLGYWVYIPRYAYEVKRYNATDRYIGMQNFNIHFEKASDAKSIPQASCNGTSISDIWKNGAVPNGTYDSSKGEKDRNGSDPDAKTAQTQALIAKPYEASCTDATGMPTISTQYHGGTLDSSSNTWTGSSWATHPAFTFGGNELNGIWVAKFETTGMKSAPLVKPNMVENTGETIGQAFTISKMIGVLDVDAVGGADASSITNTLENGQEQTIQQNSHHLATAKSHLIRNSDWGATTILTASIYGAGATRAANYMNNGATNSDGETKDSDGTPVDKKSGRATGCGPTTDNNPNAYSKTSGTDTLKTPNAESEKACSDDGKHAYNQQYGVYASTTTNVYGIYDMAGGAWEKVAAGTTNKDGYSSSYCMNTGPDDNGNCTPLNDESRRAKVPYVDVYEESKGFDKYPTWSIGTRQHKTRAYGTYLTNNDVCTWATCGGQVLHETKQLQSVTYYVQSWGSTGSLFAGGTGDGSWSGRSVQSGGGRTAGLFYTGNGGYGRGTPGASFRAVLWVAGGRS